MQDVIIEGSWRGVHGTSLYFLFFNFLQIWLFQSKDLKTTKNKMQEHTPWVGAQALVFLKALHVSTM